MIRFGRSTLLAAVLCSAMAAPFSYSTGSELDLSAGTVAISGSLTGTSPIGAVTGSSGFAAVGYNSANISKWGNIGFGGDIRFGYFFVDNFLVNFGINGSAPFSATSLVPAAFGIGVDLDYFINFGSVVVPYVGAGVDTGWIFKGNTTAWNLDVTAAVGILIGLNKNVALDLGVNLDFGIPLNNGGTTSLGIGLGYLGVRAFF